MRGGHRPRRRVHPLVQPFEDQTVAGLEKPGRIQNKPGAGRIGNNSKKTSAAPNLAVDNNYVLSFNYTRPDVMGSDNAPRCWRNVHGNLDDGNIIFGFDIADLADEQRKDPRFLRFAKTYRVFQSQKTTEMGSRDYWNLWPKERRSTPLKCTAIHSTVPITHISRRFSIVSICTPRM